MGALLAAIIKKRQEDDLIDISCLFDIDDDDYVPFFPAGGWVLLFAMPILIFGLIFLLCYFV